MKSSSARRVINILMLGLIASACTGNAVKGPLSLNEAKNDNNIRLTLHYPDPSTEYSSFVGTYYYFDGNSELQLDAYFTSKDPQGELIRVAKLSTFNVNGQLVIPEEIVSGQVDIEWAQGSRADKCKVLSYGIRDEPITGNPYQSCLYWFGMDGFRYKLYTIWPESETTRFANSLIEIKR